MKGAEYLIRALEHEGVEVIFGYPGGAIMPVYDALIGASLRHILVRHEQGAALAASGYARSSGRVGVCLATSGPGATNLVTGLADAYMDSVPLVAITGQVATPLMGTDAFQEVDVFGLTMAIVKHSFQPKTAAELPAVMQQAFHIARSGRPGPVLIDLPKDVALAEAGAQLLPPSPRQGPPPPAAVSLAQAIALYQQSSRPLIYAGGGVAMGGYVEAFRTFVKTTRMPVVATLKGLGLVSDDEEELFLGMLGMHGTKAANFAVQSCDLLLAIGARFDDRATGHLASFAKDAKVIHLDVDPAEVGKLRRPDVSLIGDLLPSLRALGKPLAIDAWRRTCRHNKTAFRWDYQAPGPDIYAPRLLHNLLERAPRDTIVACDVGQHQMWVAQHGRLSHPNQHLTSGGLGTMGYGLPAAIGAQFAFPDRLVVVVSGDGSIMMNIQELATVNRYQLPVKILLLDNHRLGMVRQWQELFFSSRLSEVSLDDNPDFGKVAESFGIPAMRISTDEDEAAAIDALLHRKGPLFVHALIDPAANVWPLVPPGRDNSYMLERMPS